MVSSGSTFTSLSASVEVLLVNHLHPNQELGLQVYLELLSFSFDLLEDYHVELYIIYIKYNIHTYIYIYIYIYI